MSHPDFTDEELLALLRDGTVSPEAIASEMQDAGVPPLPVDALASARAQLADLAAADPNAVAALPPALRTLVVDVAKQAGASSFLTLLEPAMEAHDARAPLSSEALAQARQFLADVSTATPDAVAALPAGLRTLVVDAAIDAKAAPLLAALASHKDKAVCKDGKRALHALKSRGIAVEAAKVEAPKPVAAPVDPESQPSAWMSLPDGFGERVVFLSMPTRGGIDVAEVVISDEMGVMAARLAQLSRKDFRKFVAGLPKSGRLCMAEAPRPYVRALVSAALVQNDRAGKPVPPEFNEVSFALGPSAPRSPSPGRQLPTPEDAPQIAAQSREMVALDEFKGWLPAESALRTLALKLDEIAVSPLFIDDAQKDQARKDAMDTAVRAYWTETRRRQAADRLFDAAYLLEKAGRAAPARFALGTAAVLDDTERPVEAISFCWAVFEKVVGYLRGNERAPAPTVRNSGLILP